MGSGKTVGAEAEVKTLYYYVKVEGHHYERVPTFWEVFRRGDLRSRGWFFREADAGAFCEALTESEQMKADRQRDIIVLMECGQAINSLSEDALGFGESGGAQWPLRDELIAAIIARMPNPDAFRAALSASTLPSDQRQPVEDQKGQKS